MNTAGNESMLFQRGDVRVFREGAACVVVEVREPWWVAPVARLIALLFLPVGLAYFGDAAVVPFRVPPPNNPVDWAWRIIDFTVPLSFALVVTLIQVMCLLGVLRSWFVRRVAFDFEAGVCSLRHVPGLGWAVALGRIESVDLLTRPSGSGPFAELCLKEKGESRRLSVCTDGLAYAPLDQRVARLLPLAELMARLLGRPVRQRRADGFRVDLR